MTPSLLAMRRLGANVAGSGAGVHAGRCHARPARAPALARRARAGGKPKLALLPALFNRGRLLVDAVLLLIARAGAAAIA